MVAGDVKLICFFNGKLVDDDRYARYIGGFVKADKIPNGTTFTSFRKKIQTMVKLPSDADAMDFKIKCGVSFDEFTLIAVDVNDDKSLQFVMDHCQVFIRAYVEKHVPPRRTFIATQREKVVLPVQADNHLHDQTAICVYNDRLSLLQEHNEQEDVNSMMGMVDANKFTLLTVESHPEELNHSTSNSNEKMDSVEHSLDDVLCHGGGSITEPFNNHLVKALHLSRGNFDGYKGNEVDTSWRDGFLCSPDINDVVTSPDINIALQNSSNSTFGTSYDSAASGSGEIDFYVGREFDDIDALRNTLSDLAVMTGHDYRPVRTTPFKLIMKCISEGCNWYVQASRLTKLPTFKVTKYQKTHTCLSRQTGHAGDHRQATIRWIVSKIQSSIEKNPDMEPSKIVKEIKDRFGINISYNKAVKAKTKSLERINNPFRESYALLPKLIKELEWHGSLAKLGLLGGSFQYFFWAFSACIHALRAPLRPILFVYAKMVRTGFLMYACGIDGNGFCGQVIHVAFAVFVAEDDRAWKTFISCLNEFIILDNFGSHPFTIVTDYKKAAVCAVENVLPDVHHFYFTETFKEVFLANFKDCGLAEHWVEASEAASPSACEEALQNIKSINESAYEWLTSIGLSHWTYAFSNVHCRACPSSEDNMSKELVELPIVNIVKKTRDMVAEYFSIRHASQITNLTSSMACELESAKAELSLVKIESIQQNQYEVVGPDYSYIVDLGEKSCSCGEFQVTGCPCRHAIMTVLHLDLDVATYYNPWFTTETYRATYSEKLPAISDISKWKRRYNEVHIFPQKRQRAGRPRRNFVNIK